MSKPEAVGEYCPEDGTVEFFFHDGRLFAEDAAGCQQTLLIGLDEKEARQVVKYIADSCFKKKELSSTGCVYRIAIFFNAEDKWQTTVLYSEYGQRDYRCYGQYTVKEARLMANEIERKINDEKNGRVTIFRIQKNASGRLFVYSPYHKQIFYIQKGGPSVKEGDVIEGTIYPDLRQRLIRAERKLEEGKDYLLRRRRKSTGASAVRLASGWYREYCLRRLHECDLVWIPVGGRKDGEYDFLVTLFCWLSDDERRILLLEDMPEWQKKEYLEVHLSFHQ